MSCLFALHLIVLRYRCIKRNSLLYYVTSGLLFISSFANAQPLSGYILRKTDSIAIPYSMVGVVGKTIAVHADEQGHFKIDANAGDSLEVIAPGYETLKHPASIMPPKIYLEPRKISLQEVSVIANKIKATTGTAFNKTNFTFSSHLGVEFALKLKLESRRPKQLQKIIIRAKHTSSANLIRLHLYKVNEDGLPGEVLLPETILLNDYHIRRGKLEIDLLPLNLYCADEYLFVGLEWVGTDNTQQGMQIGFTHDKSNEMVCFTRKNNRNDEWPGIWVPFSLNTHEFKHSVPQISIEYSY